MGRFRQLALRPLHRFLAGDGVYLPEKVKSSRSWWAAALPFLDPRQISGFKESPPGRVYSDSAGLGAFAFCSSLCRGVVEHPIPITRSADDQPRQPAQTAGADCITGL